MRSLLRKALPAVINLCMASNIFINVNAAEIKNQQVENQAEVFYHLFQRSFYDTNGDTHGDLNGIVSKLDYLQDLGVTSLLLLPLYPSIYHHNYFAASFEGIDAEYGDMNDYITMVESIHNRGMKFYMDTEIQYATENHPWFKDSRNNPASPYSEYIIYRDKENKEPETTIFDITHLQSHDGINADITTVNLNSPKVKKYMRELFTFWVDPNKDGDFSDGVDGFRIDHMMDDLDEKGILTNLLTNFWAPLFKQLKAINPRLKIIGEQADWTHYGDEYFEKADVDMTFGFAIREGLISLDKALIEKNTKATFAATPADKNQLLLLENHDLPRFATVVKSHPGKMRIAAAYLMLSEGVPLVYYGQELGMEGLGGIGKESSSFADANDKTQSTNNDWDSAKVPSASDLKKLMDAIKNTTVNDGADIPIREAFEWYSQVEGPGMSYWYKDIERWWKESNLKDHDGISLEEQQLDPRSLWNTYKDLIALRKSQPALATGEQRFAKNNNKNLLTFIRSDKNDRFLVAINLSSEYVNTTLSKHKITGRNGNTPTIAYFTEQAQIKQRDKTFLLQLEPFGFGVWKL